MEQIFNVAINSLLAMILLSAAMMLYLLFKEMVYKAAYVGTKLSGWGRVGLVILFVMSVSAVLSAYVTGLARLDIAENLFYSLQLNTLLLQNTLYLYAAFVAAALPSLVTLYISGTAFKRENKKKIHKILVIKQKIESFYEELDHAIFVYLARKNGIEKSAGNFKDYRYFSSMQEDLSCKECLVTLYYALLLNRKYIDKLDDKIEDTINILSHNIPENDKEAAALYKKTLIVSGKIKKKLEEILAFFKSHKDITVVGDDEMPHFYIEGHPDESMEILRKFEELSIVILDNKHLSDALLASLSEKIAKLEQKKK